MNPKRNVENLQHCLMIIRGMATKMLLNNDDDEAMSLFAIANDLNGVIAEIYELYDIPVPKEDDIPF